MGNTTSAATVTLTHEPAHHADHTGTPVVTTGRTTRRHQRRDDWSTPAPLEVAAERVVPTDRLETAATEPLVADAPAHARAAIKNRRAEGWGAAGPPSQDGSERRR